MKANFNNTDFKKGVISGIVMIVFSVVIYSEFNIGLIDATIIVLIVSTIINIIPEYTRNDKIMFRNGYKIGVIVGIFPLIIRGIVC